MTSLDKLKVTLLSWDGDKDQPALETFLKFSIRVQSEGGRSEVAESYSAGVALAGCLELVAGKISLSTAIANLSVQILRHSE